VIQQNAGAAEEISSTSQELSSQADELLQTISFFKINGNGSATHALPSSPTKVMALDHVQAVRPRQPRPEMAYARAESGPAGVHLDLGVHGGGNGKNGNYSDKRDAEFEEF
jgi:methyl-accepting chemotaxis protein